MGRLILALLITLLFCSCIYGNDSNNVGDHKSFTFWGLNQKDFASESPFTARVGYQFDDFIFDEPNNAFEGFVGTTWMPPVEGEEGKIDPPTTLSLGGIYHLGDIIDKNSPIPWINTALLTLLPEEMEANPYFGALGTWQFVDDDGAYFGVIGGLLAKTKPDSKFEYVFEAGYTNFFGPLEPIKDDDEFVISVGLRFRTK